MGSVTALSRWLVFVALLRLLSVYFGYFQPSYLQHSLFDRRPEQVTDLHGRTFAVWTLTTCALCLICARNPRDATIYAATLFSFVVAILHFAGEVLVYRTMSWRSAVSPLAVAGAAPATPGQIDETLQRARKSIYSSSLLLGLTAFLGTNFCCSGAIAPTPASGMAEKSAREWGSTLAAVPSVLWMAAGFNYYTFHSLVEGNDPGGDPGRAASEQSIEDRKSQ